jgi:hypothetical protein
LGNFLVIIAPSEGKVQSEVFFQAGLANAQRIKNIKPSGILQTDWVQAASFARLNGSGKPVVCHEATGCWLCVVGTWFHANGDASEDEAQLLERIIEIGPDRLAQELEGFFSIVFGDARSREIFVITDVIGSRHCFYRSIGRCQALSTSSLLLGSLGEVSLDAIGCEEFLRTGVIYEDRTFFREVRKILPARIMRFAGGGPVSESRYWRITRLDPEKLDGRQAARELGEKLVGTARKVGKFFAHPVCDLTGGYDSRAVVAAFLAAGVSFETTVAGAAESADTVVSQGLSKLTGKPHWHFEIDTRVSLDQLKQALQLTDGEYDLVQYSRTFLIHDQLSTRYDISINGSFGELARGYWWQLLWPRIGKTEPLDSHKIAARRYVVEPSYPGLLPRERGLSIEHFARVIERANAGLYGWPNTAQLDNTYLELRMHRWQGRIASSTDQIWPCLSPLMLRSVLETMIQTKAHWRYRSLLMRMMVADLNPQLAAYPLEHGHPMLPMTWRNWPRFLPALRPYARKALVKMERKMRRSNETVAHISAVEPARLQLWRDDEVRDLLNPESMQLNELTGKRGLRDFLDASRGTNFAFEDQWNYILSVEMALRALH